MKKLLSVVLSVLIAACTFTGIPLYDGEDLTFSSSLAISADAVSSKYTEMLPYYCSFMSQRELSLYLQLRQAVMEFQPKITLGGSVSDEMYNRLIYTLFYYDCLTFNLAGAGPSGSSMGTSVRLDYCMDSTTYDIMRSEMDSVAEEVTAAVSKQKTEYKKIKYIYDYITDNTVYTEDGDFSHFTYGALCSGEAVCEGYAGAFNYLCTKAGITAVNVIGTAGGENHMWNKVMCYGKWYCVDATWDDPLTNYKGAAKYSYFLIDDEQLNMTHTEQPMGYTSPAATDSSGSYYDKNSLVAEDKYSAKKLLISKITSAAKKGKLSVTIKFKDKKTYESVTAYLEKDKSAAAIAILESAKKKSGKDIVTSSVWSVKNPDALTYTMCIVYDGSNISDYFYDASLLDKDTLKNFKKLGVNIKK